MVWILVGVLGFLAGGAIGVTLAVKYIAARLLCGAIKLTDPIELRIIDSEPLEKGRKYIMLKVDYGKDRE